MNKQSEAKTPIRYYAQGLTKGTNQFSFPQDMVVIPLTPEECRALNKMLYVISTDPRLIVLNLSPKQTTDEIQKRECAVAFNAFKKIAKAQPGSLVIDESEQIVLIPDETKPHLIELIKSMNTIAERASKNNAPVSSSASAKYVTPENRAWAEIAAWPSPITPALQQRRTMALKALDEITNVIPQDLKSNYNGKHFQLFPSKESSALVGLIYFTVQFHVLEILHRAPDELKPYLSHKKIQPTASHKESLFVLMIKDPDLHASSLKDSLHNYFSQCSSAESGEQKPNSYSF